jgi:molybdate transport system regulatory protein
MTKTKARAEFHLRVVKGRTRAIGPGKIALLEAIRDTGSISAAARKLRMSYRRAWVLVDDLNRRLLNPVVLAAPGGKHGGGTTLSPTGLKLIGLYRDIERRALLHTSSAARALLGLLEE